METVTPLSHLGPMDRRDLTQTLDFQGRIRQGRGGRTEPIYHWFITVCTVSEESPLCQPVPRNSNMYSDFRLRSISTHDLVVFVDSNDSASSPGNAHMRAEGEGFDFTVDDAPASSTGQRLDAGNFVDSCSR
jgi:hypothetical protein